MERGTVLESDARSLYELINEVEVKQVGFVYKDERRLIGCSPDGLIHWDTVKDKFNKGYETKCPAPHTHIEYLLSNKLPTKYKVQVQGSMWVCEMDYWDFMSFYPGMPPVIIRVERDTKLIKAISEEVEYFVETMLEKREKLETLK